MKMVQSQFFYSPKELKKVNFLFFKSLKQFSFFMIWQTTFESISGNKKIVLIDSKYKKLIKSFTLFKLKNFLFYELFPDFLQKKTITFKNCKNFF